VVGVSTIGAMSPRHPIGDADTHVIEVDTEDTQIIDMGQGPPKEPEAPPAESPQPKKRRRWRRVLLMTALVMVLLGGGGLVTAGLYLRSVNSDIERINAFEELPEETRPDKVSIAKSAKNFLVLGSDSRDPANTSGSRSDTIMLAHVSNDRSSAQLISIPRDTWVHVPRSADGKRGNTSAKINAAFAWGGVPLVVQTVEAFTGVRIDHVVIIDFAGFKEIVDALGGVEIDVEYSFTSTHSLTPDGIRRFKKGRQVMDGATALDYARERFALRDGDFGRIRHQQQVVKAILDKASTGGLLANPVRLNSFLQATADAVAVDQTLNLFDMAMELRHLRSENLAFYTSPYKGTGPVGGESVVFPDTVKATKLFDAVRRDAVAEIAAAAAS
jgi:LCP family protein required for cell wall assembly